MSALERAARELVERSGHNPDERVPYAHPSGFAVACTRPRWASAAEEIRKHYEILRLFDQYPLHKELE